jgi:hypothetical protein
VVLDTRLGLFLPVSHAMCSLPVWVANASDTLQTALSAAAAYTSTMAPTVCGQVLLSWSAAMGFGRDVTAGKWLVLHDMESDMGILCRCSVVRGVTVAEGVDLHIALLLRDATSLPDLAISALHALHAWCCWRPRT